MSSPLSLVLSSPRVLYDAGAAIFRRLSGGADNNVDTAAEKSEQCRLLIQTCSYEQLRQWCCTNPGLMHARLVRDIICNCKLPTDFKIALFR